MESRRDEERTPGVEVSFMDGSGRDVQLDRIQLVHKLASDALTQTIELSDWSKVESSSGLSRTMSTPAA